MSSHFEDRRRALAKFVVAGVGLVSAGLASLVGLVASPRSAGSARALAKSRISLGSACGCAIYRRPR